MGVKKLFRKLGCGKVHAGVIVVGLANSGKTTCVHVLSNQPVEEVVPTVGFSIENFETKQAKIRVVDLSGAAKYMSLWPHYYREVQAVIFVVDAADPSRFQDAADCLSKVLAHEDLRGRPLLVLANKQDLPHATQPAQVAQLLGLTRITGREYTIRECSALKGTGVQEGVSWLLTRVKQ
uniref:ADP-ribosylation factor-like protein 6 n=1 Tax=Chlamydomonas leiostraca TaxID=1034604 RepID=A0A7S0S3I3_9CHLO|mmetsp:Transcript_6021/g.14944  ORF Transcript_6021/g.14944 Transcript_6021/m.14944 type:complete len:179 (+) Transcript_6021:162-698(+)